MLVRAIVSTTLLLLFSLQAAAGEIAAKTRFIEEAVKIDSASATALADNLTDADWFETDTEMLLESFQAALEVRERFAWGKTYPDSIFYRYVLPLRVDDEPLQPYRRYFLDEIGPRLDSLTTIYRAALEVNLWIGERVGFKPTDWRDQGPLTTLSCGFGRCGEEMILAIDAFRSVGIAARGVYVPFWGAFDNNHAWVEVLTEDGWKYLGAAEPATRLNKAWFDRTVLRAPLLLTKNCNYSSDHPDAVRTRSGWALNVTRNYLPPAQLTVNFPGEWGSEDLVWLAVFNFGTIRSLVELTPDNGIARLETGHGDFILFGIYQQTLFIQPFTAQTNRETHLDLEVTSRPPITFTLRYPEPPVQRDLGTEAFPSWRIDLSRELRNRRNAERDGFSPWLDSLAADLDGYMPRLLGILKRAPGNEESIVNSFLELTPEKRENALGMLELLSNKDLRDVSAEALSEWFARDTGAFAENIEVRPFILNPKVANEYPPLKSRKEQNIEPVHYKSLKNIRKDVKKYSTLINPDLHRRPLPASALSEMLAAGVKIDPRNAALWWTDRLRHARIPARKGPWNDWLEFYWEDEWLPLFPSMPEKLGDRTGLPGVEAHYETPARVTLRWLEGGTAPEYESEFLYLPLDDSGKPNYRADDPVSISKEEYATMIELVPGLYFFTAGRRNGRGDITVNARIIELSAGEETTLELDLLPPPEPPDVSGLAVQLSDLIWQPEKSGINHLLIILGDNEPSVRTRNQALELADSNLEVTLIPSLPELDTKDRETLGLQERDESSTPFVFYFDRDGKLLFTQSGYDLNLANRVRNTQLNR